MKEGMLRAHIRHDVLCAEVEFHDGASDDEIKQAMEKAGAKIMREIIDLHRPKEAHIYMHLGFDSQTCRSVTIKCGYRSRP